MSSVSRQPSCFGKRQCHLKVRPPRSLRNTNISGIWCTNSRGSASLAQWKDMTTSTLTTDKTLRIRSIRHLAWTLEISPDTLESLAEDASHYYRSFEREVKGKKRLLVESTEPLKRTQRRILDNVLMRLTPFPASFGAAKGKTIKDNAKVHAASRFIGK